MPDTSVGDLTLGRADFEDASLKSLIELHLAAMREHSPPESVHALDASGLSAPGTQLYVLSETGQAVAMGAIRRIDATTFEIKSMRVRPDRLGRGLGRAMLEHLIAEAAGRGATRLSLETGSGPAFEPALMLYQSRGFRPGEAFGGYGKTPFNRFFHLDMDPA